MLTAFFWLFILTGKNESDLKIHNRGVVIYMLTGLRDRILYSREKSCLKQIHKDMWKCIK